MYQQGKSVEIKDGVKSEDQGGHLIADLFGGSPELDNLVSQSKLVNQKAYRDIERKWQKALSANPPQKVTDIKIEIMYDGKMSGQRHLILSIVLMEPHIFQIRYTIINIL